MFIFARITLALMVFHLYLRRVFADHLLSFYPSPLAYPHESGTRPGGVGTGITYSAPATRVVSGSRFARVSAVINVSRTGHVPEIRAYDGNALQAVNLGLTENRVNGIRALTTLPV